MRRTKRKFIWEDDYIYLKQLVGKKTKNDKEFFREVKELAVKGRELDQTKERLDKIGKKVWGPVWNDWFK